MVELAIDCPRKRNSNTLLAPARIRPSPLDRIIMERRVIVWEPFLMEQARPGVSLNRTTTVGSYPPNALGVFDVDGNVVEWCWDFYEEHYYKQFQNKVATDPTGPMSSNRRVIRGASTSLRTLPRTFRQSQRRKTRFCLRLERLPRRARSVAISLREMKREVQKDFLSQFQFPATKAHLAGHQLAVTTTISDQFDFYQARGADGRFGLEGLEVSWRQHVKRLRRSCRCSSWNIWLLFHGDFLVGSQRGMH